MEIERKWLVKKEDIPFTLSEYDHWDIEQAYLGFSPTIRVRRLVNKNKYYLTIKSSSPDNGLSRQESEKEITIKEYSALFKKKVGMALYKTRYRVPVDNYMYEIDLFRGDYEGLLYLEVEFKSAEEAKKFIAPSWVGQEVTNDYRYTNASLARGLYKKLFER